MLSEVLCIFLNPNSHRSYMFSMNLVSLVFGIALKALERQLMKALGGATCVLSDYCFSELA
jgi:hypothetical protein